MVIEQDWKLYRKKLPLWQERYMERLVREYTELLLDPQSRASDKFWALQKQIQKEMKSPGVIVEMRRSNMDQILAEMIAQEIITWDDLADFTEETKEDVDCLLEIWRRSDRRMSQK